MLDATFLGFASFVISSPRATYRSGFRAAMADMYLAGGTCVRPWHDSCTMYAGFYTVGSNGRHVLGGGHLHAETAKGVFCPLHVLHSMCVHGKEH